MTSSPLIPFALTLAMASAQPQAPAAPVIAATSSQPTAEARTEAERKRKENEKLQAEIEKLRAERDSLELQNRALGVGTRKWSAIVGAIGGFTGAILTFLIGYAGLRLSRAQEARRAQDEVLARKKLGQDKALAREKQTLEIYRDLGHSNPRTQIAAASLLLQRLEGYKKKKKEGILL